MFYQYRNFRSQKAVSKAVAKEVKDLFKIVLLLIIVNLVLLSLYYSEKKKYDDKNIKCSYESKTIVHDDSGRKDQILDILNDGELCSLCRSINYSSSQVKVECAPDDLDNLYKKIKKHDCIKKCEIEGDSAKMILKMVLK